MVVGYPPGHAHGACPGGYTTPTPPPWHGPRRAPCRTARQEWASGLNRPRGDRAGWPYGHPSRVAFPYLRSFRPGIPDRLKAVWGNRWIGSRSRAPLAPWDVSDLECLRLWCGSSGSGDGGAGSGLVEPGSVSSVDGSGLLHIQAALDGDYVTKSPDPST